MALPGVDDGQPHSSCCIKQPLRRPDRSPQQRNVVAQYRAKAARLEKIPLHIDDDEPRPSQSQLEGIRFCLDHRHSQRSPADLECVLGPSAQGACHYRTSPSPRPREERAYTPRSWSNAVEWVTVPNTPPCILTILIACSWFDWSVAPQQSSRSRHSNPRSFASRIVV